MVEVIRFVWLLFFLWWDTKGVFLADSGEIRHSLYCCGENEWGAFTIDIEALDGDEFGEGVDGAEEELGRVVICLWVSSICFMLGMVAEGGGWWQGGVGIWGESPSS